MCILQNDDRVVGRYNKATILGLGLGRIPGCNVNSVGQPDWFVFKSDSALAWFTEGRWTAVHTVDI